MGATKKDRRINAVLSVLLGILCVAWLYPVFMILMNSLKTERAITTTHAFELPNADTFVGLKNYIYGIQEMDFLSSFWYSFIITVSSVALILLCCSMCAWYITRVQGVLSKGMYYLCVFSMIVPFQMVMFTPDSYTHLESAFRLPSHCNFRQIPPAARGKPRGPAQ